MSETSKTETLKVNLKVNLNQAASFKANLDGNIRSEIYNNKAHTVVPVIALVEGVHNGILYTQEELNKHPAAWSGVPITLDHPVGNDGMPISANSPPVLDTLCVGRFFNTAIKDNTKLYGEIWLENARINALRPEIIPALNAKEPLEVSTGLFMDAIPQSGTWNEEPYNEVATNFRPDHLAILPDAKGACSWEDGCGAPRNNKTKPPNNKGGEETNMDENLKTANNTTTETETNSEDNDKKSFLTRMKEFFKGNETNTELKDNELSYGTKRQVIIERLREEQSNNPNYSYIWLSSNYMFSDHFVYELEDSTGKTKLYKRGYNVDANDNITLHDNIEEVRAVVSFEPVKPAINKENTDSDDGIKTNTKTETPNTNTEENMNTDEMVNAIIANEQIECFTEDDRDALTAMKECQLNLILNQVKGKEDNKQDTEAPKPAANVENNADNKQDISEERIAALVAAELQKEKVSEAVNRILANKFNKFGKETLSKMTLNELQEVESNLIPVGQFDTRGAFIPLSSDGENAVPDMPSVLAAKVEGNA